MLVPHTHKTLERLLPTPATPVAIAVSGGADSMALLLLAHTYCSHLTCLTVNHGFRPEAEAEAAQVKAWCAELGITHITLTNTAPAPKSALQEEARRIRYTLMRQWCTENNVDYLLTAHHLNDQIETYRLRKERGSSDYGLACMAEHALLGKINLLRPLLSVPKQALVTFMQEQGQQWIEDPSNDNPDFARTQVRNALKHEKELNQYFEHIRELGKKRQTLEVTLNTFIDGHIEEPLPFILALEHSAYKALHKEQVTRLLSHLLCYISQNLTQPRGENIEHLHTALLTAESGVVGTLHHVQLLVKKGQLFLFHEPSRLPTLALPAQWANKYAIEGDSSFTISPLGEKGAALLKKMEAPLPTIPSHALRSAPVIYKNDTLTLENILAAPHIIEGKTDAVSYRLEHEKKLAILPFSYCRSPVYDVV